MVLEILEMAFMQRALVSAVTVAVICSLVGLFLVLRRQSLFGDAISHMAFGGIAVGLFVQMAPLWTALVVSILGALGITKLRQSARISPDASIAVLLSSGIALGTVLISLSGGFSVDLFSFLFGSILLVSTEDTYMILGLAAVILVTMTVLYRKLMYIAFNEEQAKVSGLSVTMLNYLFIIIASTTVIASIRLVGILLISSLIVIPNIAAMMLGKSFKKTILASISISVSSVITGIFISYYANLAPGGTIVMVTIAVLLGMMAWKYASNTITKSEKPVSTTQPSL